MTNKELENRFNYHVNGMEMPKSCGYCPFENHTDDGYECRINGCLTEYQKRPSDCPLVPVPAHGRLIDADALEDFVIALKRDAIHAYEWTGKSGEWNTRITERERFAVTIEDAPTIIPADPAEEGE